MKLIAVNTKSHGWVKALHAINDTTWLEFELNNDGLITVATIRSNPLCDGGVATSLSYNYPMSDVIDYIKESK